MRDLEFWKFAEKEEHKIESLLEEWNEIQQELLLVLVVQSE